MDLQRGRSLNSHSPTVGPVCYWMSRDQRTEDNWALLAAQAFALERQRPLAVVFCLVPTFLEATQRHYTFMLAGLRETAVALAAKNIPFYLLTGEPAETLPRFAADHQISALFTDFSPLRLGRTWRAAVAQAVTIPLYEVDAHNIIPCWAASPKQEFAARTFRPKVHEALPHYLEPLPALAHHPFPWPQTPPAPAWDTLLTTLPLGAVEWLPPGPQAADACLETFISLKLPLFAEYRNDPNRDVLSNLSPYLHFGQIAAQRVALSVKNATAPAEAKAAFLEELIVRRELSDNFCFYNPHYDRFTGFPAWGQQSLNQHRHDPRPHRYELADFEQGQTHDDLWNAAQLEMVQRGKMHGYLRMYWAKKILEWSQSPERALEIAIYLNDRYQLDGRDPNGYTGIAWSIGGLHDRPFQERPIYGKIRYMSYDGSRRKFDIKSYIKKYGHPI
jgi:deoxyribodipyrimidine photo-lyase